MTVWFRCELSLGKLENRFAWVVETKCFLNLQKYPFALIQYPAIGKKCISRHANSHKLGARMIDRVVYHFRNPILPYLSNVFREIGNKRGEHFPPGDVFSQTLPWVTFFSGT